MNKPRQPRGLFRLGEVREKFSENTASPPNLSASNPSFCSSPKIDFGDLYETI